MLFLVSIFTWTGCAAQPTLRIKAKVEVVEEGTAVLLAVPSGDTLMNVEVHKGRFDQTLKPISDPKGYQVALLFCQRSDGRGSISGPMLLENGTLIVELHEFSPNVYDGTPLQREFNGLASRVQYYTKLLAERNSDKMEDSIRYQMGSIMDTFYLNRKDSKLREFLAIIYADFIGRGILVPGDLPLISAYCRAETLTDSIDQMLCSRLKGYIETFLGRPYIDMEELTADSSPFQLKQWIGKKPVVLDFWASWCGPCLQDMPKLRDIHQKFDVEIIGISIDNRAQAWLKGLASLELPWINIRDSKRTIAEAYQITAVPTKIVIDRRGVIVARNPDNLEALLTTFGKN